MCKRNHQASHCTAFSFASECQSQSRPQSTQQSAPRLLPHDIEPMLLLLLCCCPYVSLPRSLSLFLSLGILPVPQQSLKRTIPSPSAPLPLLHSYVRSAPMWKIVFRSLNVINDKKKGASCSCGCCCCICGSCCCCCCSSMYGSCCSCFLHLLILNVFLINEIASFPLESLIHFHILYSFSLFCFPFYSVH